MVKSIIIWLLALVVVCQSYSLNFYEEDNLYATCGEKKCHTQGVQCKNCSTLVRCIEEDEGSFVEVEIKSCNIKDGEFCYKDRECSKEFNACCNAPPYIFKCSAVGMFPDPYDCTKYHVCTKASGKFVDNPYVCTGKYGYNMRTTYCDVQLPDGQCPDVLPVPLCQQEQQTGALENKSIWYICVKQGSYLVPELHLCPHGHCYNGVICAPDCDPTTTLPTTTTTYPTPTTTIN